MLNKCKYEQYQTSKWIKKLENTLINAQQMSIQQVVHITLSITFYFTTRSFQFINTCNELLCCCHKKYYTIYPLHQQTYIVIIKDKEWHHSLENVFLP